MSGLGNMGAEAFDLEDGEGLYLGLSQQEYQLLSDAFPDDGTEQDIGEIGKVVCTGRIDGDHRVIWLHFVDSGVRLLMDGSTAIPHVHLCDENNSVIDEDGESPVDLLKRLAKVFDSGEGNSVQAYRRGIHAVVRARSQNAGAN